MAGRGGVKLKEYRTNIGSVRQWLNELEASQQAILVVELYTTFFQPCQVILPFINQLMLNIEDASTKVHWLTINVGKLEEEQKNLLLEEEKKRNQQLSSSGQGGGASESLLAITTTNAEEFSRMPPTASHGGEIPSSPNNSATSNLPTKHSKPSWDKIYIPKLERYSGYDHPRPLWLFIRDSSIVYTVDSCNPPKMQRILNAMLQRSTLTEEELDVYNLVGTSEEELKQRRIRKAKAEEEKAKRRALERRKTEKRKKLAAKPHITRTNEVVIHIGANVTNKDAISQLQSQALVVVYRKEEETGEYVYLFQSDVAPWRTNEKQSTEVSFSKPLYFPKDTTIPAAHNAEWRVALYDSKHGEVWAKENPEAADRRLVAETYIQWKDIISHKIAGDSAAEWLACPLLPAATEGVASLSSGSPRHAFAVHANHQLGCIKIKARDAESEGVISSYSMNSSVVASSPPAGELASTNALPILLKEQSYSLRISAKDTNTATFGVIETLSLTHDASTTNGLTWQTPKLLNLQAYSNFDRQIRFEVLRNASADVQPTVVAENESSLITLLQQKAASSDHHTVIVSLQADSSMQQALQILLNITSLDGSDEDSFNSGAAGMQEKLELQLEIVNLPSSLVASPDFVTVFSLFHQLPNQELQYLESDLQITSLSADHLRASHLFLVPKPDDVSAQIYFVQIHHVPQAEVRVLPPEMLLKHEDSKLVLSSKFSANSQLLVQADKVLEFECTNAQMDPLEDVNLRLRLADVGSVELVSLSFELADNTGVSAPLTVTVQETRSDDRTMELGTTHVRIQPSNSETEQSSPSNLLLYNYTELNRELLLTVKHSETLNIVGQVELQLNDYLQAVRKFDSVPLTQSQVTSPEAATEDQTPETVATEGVNVPSLGYKLMLHDIPINDGQTQLIIKKLPLPAKEGLPLAETEANAPVDQVAYAEHVNRNELQVPGSEEEHIVVASPRSSRRSSHKQSRPPSEKPKPISASNRTARASHSSGKATTSKAAPRSPQTSSRGAASKGEITRSKPSTPSTNASAEARSRSSARQNVEPNNTASTEQVAIDGQKVALEPSEGNATLQTQATTPQNYAVTGELQAE